jgi:predicted amidohydrolase YtcJ
MRINDKPVLISGGPIHVMDEGLAKPEAVLLANGKVAGVGKANDLAAKVGSGLERIDLKGATAIPGLVDCHPHLLHFAARKGSFVELGDAKSHAEIVERIRAKAKDTPAGKWIYCTPIGDPYYYHRGSYHDLAERRMPDRWVLDQATTKHPVMIQGWGPKTPSIVAFNSMALKALAITDITPARVCDVWVDRDEQGRVSGVLRGSVTTLYCFDPYWTQLITKLPPPDIDIQRTTRQAMAEYNAMGVTTIYEPHNMTKAHIEAYEKLHSDGALSMRVMAAMETEMFAFAPLQPLSLEDYKKQLDLARSLNRDGDDWFKVVGATLSEGGPCWSGYMRTFDPSLDPYGRPNSAFRFASREKEMAFAEYCLQHDLRANFLAVGHVDHEDFLDVLEELAGKGKDIKSKGWVLQHAMLISEAQGKRYKALGFDLTTTNSFSWGKGDLYAERIGKHVWKDLIPLARLFRQGINIGGGSDWGPKYPFEQITLAQTHEFGGSGHRNNTPDHAIPRHEAVAMWTRRAGQVLHWPGVGTLEAGSYADVAIVDRDPLTCSIEELPKTKILRTVLGGRTVYTA